MKDEGARTNAQAALGYVFRDPALLAQALTHASTNAESNLANNERLEFLGDAVLGVVVCELLFRNYPHLREGDMTKIKSLAVSRETCAQIARGLGLERFIVVGKGMRAGANLPASLAAAALESVIGAIYLDGGFDAARNFILPLVLGIIEKAAASGHQQNFKSVLQQHAIQEMGAAPVYRVLDEQGPDHAKAFKVCVEISGKRYEPTWGATKKKAEQDAALIALRALGLVGDDGVIR
ncbi:MAG TPA: ribonuclease III [Phycisphaerales bacterium]|nr:ribonuclease III [Phycisphaerales bacterium]